MTTLEDDMVNVYSEQIMSLCEAGNMPVENVRYEARVLIREALRRYELLKEEENEDR